MNLIFSWRAEYLDNFDKLVDSGLAWEKWLANEKLRNDAANRPDINSWCVVSSSKNEFRCPIVTRADVRNVYFALDKALCRTEIANLKSMALRVYKQVLRLDVAVTVAERVDVRERTETLIGVQFDEENGHRLLHLVVVLEDAVDRLRNVVHDDV